MPHSMKRKKTKKNNRGRIRKPENEKKRKGQRNDT